MVRHLKLKLVLFYQVLRLSVNVTWKYAFINGEIKVHGTLALYKSSSNTFIYRKRILQNRTCYSCWYFDCRRLAEAHLEPCLTFLMKSFLWKQLVVIFAKGSLIYVRHGRKDSWTKPKLLEIKQQISFLGRLRTSTLETFKQYKSYLVKNVEGKTCEDEKGMDAKL